MTEIRGIILECHRDGRIIAIQHDSLGLISNEKIGQPFTFIVSPADHTKALSFLSAVNRNQAQYGWEINVIDRNRPHTFFFSGGISNGKIILIINDAPPDFETFFQEISGIVNEQTDFIRTITKERGNKAIEGHLKSSMAEEFSKLYNEFTTIQRELAKKNVELREISERKSMMLGVAAHDLRNPLGVISGYAEFLEETVASKLNEREVRMIRHIRESSAFMQRLIEDMLNFSQAETGKVHLNRQPSNLDELIEISISLNDTMASRKSISIGYQTPDTECPIVDIDPSKVRQVLNNLISNSIKFSHNGTSITVSLSVLEGFVSVSVSDQGQGIPSDELTMLFKPYTRTSVKTTGGEPSWGIGLTICRNIIEAHGGTIITESTPGVGTTQTFTLPIWKGNL